MEIKRVEIENSSVIRWLWIFVICYALAWTLAPWSIRATLPLDAMEGTTWGHQLEWGYDKNPFLGPWLTALAVKLGGVSGFSIYLFSQLSVVLCFYAVWKLGKKILPPIYAAVSVLILSCVQYFNLHAIDFNDNTLELAGWALLILFFYKSLIKDKWIYWMLTGVFAALSLMIKYYSLMLIVPLFLFLVCNKHARQCFKNPGVYLALIIFVMIITPHCLWLAKHDFITINYAITRTSLKKTHLINHFYFPVEFLSQQIQALLPALIMLILLIFKKKPSSTVNDSRSQTFQISSLILLSRKLSIIQHIIFFLKNLFIQVLHIFNHKTFSSMATNSSFLLKKVSNLISRHREMSLQQQFVLCITLGPLALTLLLSLVLGIKLHAGWGQPLLSFSGLLIFLWWRPQITTKRFYIFMLTLFIIQTISIIVYCFTLSHPRHYTSAIFPGKEIAATVTSIWQEQFHQPLKYIAGERWLAGNIAFYSQDHPQVYIDWNKKVSTWVDEEELRKNGGVFVWDLTPLNRRKQVSYKTVKQRFPHLKEASIVNFAWKKGQFAPAQITVAFLPPKDTINHRL